MEEAAAEIKPSKYDRPENWKPPKPKPKKEVKKDDDDDAEMDDVVKPKRPPPKGLGKKPKAKIQKDEEEEKEAAPAKSEAPKKTVGGGGSSQGPTAPLDNDENVGAGLSSEDAIAMVTDSISADVVNAFDSAKWQDKVAGFEGLQAHIRENEPEHELLEAISKFIKAKMKGFKEPNINLLKGTVATFDVMARDS